MLEARFKIALFSRIPRPPELLIYPVELKVLFVGWSLAQVQMNRVHFFRFINLLTARSEKETGDNPGGHDKHF